MNYTKIVQFFYLAIFLFLSACAMNNGATLPTVEEQENRWNLFINSKLQEKPYALQGSFRFGDSENTNRVNYILWSNGAHPLRLDILAGVGTSLAKVLETDEEITMYFPEQKRAIIMGNFDEINPLISLGMPVPISFYEMSYVLRGGFNEILEDIKLTNVKQKRSKKDYQKYTYYFDSKKMSGLMQLDFAGKPVHCEINDEWVFDISYDDENLPYKVVITSLVEDYRAILLVKSRTTPKPYTDSDFQFALPSDTEVCEN